jgi:hypothetical protein
MSSTSFKKPIISFQLISFILLLKSSKSIEIRLRDRLRKNVFKFGRESDTLKYKKQRNKVNNMKKKAKENFDSNLGNILLDNSTNPKTYHFVI